MKRMRDEMYMMKPQFKRPYGFSTFSGEVHVSSHASVGGGGGNVDKGGVGGSSNINGSGTEVGHSSAGIDVGSTYNKPIANDALSYLKQVKDMFRDQKDKYDNFLHVMKEFKSQRIDTLGVILKVKELFKGHPNLIVGFNTFLPNDYEITLAHEEGAPPKRTIEFEEAISFANRIKKRFRNNNRAFKTFIDILKMIREKRKGITEAAHEVATLLIDHQDLLEEFATFLPDASATLASIGRHAMTQSYITKQQLPRNQILEPNRERDSNIEQPNIDGDKTVAKSREEHKKLTDKENQDRRNSDQDDGEPNTDNNGAIILHKLFEKGKYAQKVQGWGGSSNSALCDDENALTKHAVEGGKETSRHNLKYWEKPINEIDLSNYQLYSPSYRLLPKDYPMVVVSERLEIEAEVLNDHLVSVAPSGEDHTFKRIKKNQYEQSLFRCEDDMYEMDMLLESINSAAKRIEDLLNDNSNDLESPIRIEHHLTTLNLRFIEQLYGDHGLDVIDNLRKNPSRVATVILMRLKQKQEEWTKCHSEFSKVWAKVYSQNHQKSLDHRNVCFEQQESKKLSTKYDGMKDSLAKMLQRNMNKYVNLDSEPALRLATQNALIMDRLQCKMCAYSSKLLYISNTEDYYILPRQRRNQSTMLLRHQAMVQQPM